MSAFARFGWMLIPGAALTFGAGLDTKSTADHPIPAYRLKLDPFLTPPTRLVGMIVKTRINGGPPLRLLLDSGADMITLDPRAAAKSNCTGGIDFDLVGAGAQTAAGVKQVRASTVEIGDFSVADVPVLISGRAVAEGIQGVLPLSLFSAFLIRLDVPRRALDLFPYPAGASKKSEDLEAISSDRLLFVRGTVNDRREGYFLLDTGASYSAVSKTVARDLKISELMAQRVPLQAGTTELDAPVVGNSVRLRFGGRELGSGSVVAIDLSGPSRYHHFDIAGLLGFPALSNSVLMVNYRDHQVRIDSR